MFILASFTGFYSCFFYLVAAFSNNSFALTPDTLIVINPNFPFRKHTIIPLHSITNIYIGEHSPIWRMALLLFANYYINVHVGNNITRYYCIGLEADAYDENLTEKTIEDFAHELKKRNLEVKISAKIDQ